MGNGTVWLQDHWFLKDNRSSKWNSIDADRSQLAQDDQCGTIINDEVVNVFSRIVPTSDPRDETGHCILRLFGEM